MTETNQQTEGIIYKISQRGYSNEGKQPIKFPSNVNFLSVHSRCNQIFKNKSKEIDEKDQQFKQFHCLNLSEPKRELNNLSIQKKKISLPKINKARNKENVNFHIKPLSMEKQSQNLQKQKTSGQRSSNLNLTELIKKPHGNITQTHQLNRTLKTLKKDDELSVDEMLKKQDDLKISFLDTQRLKTKQKDSSDISSDNSQNDHITIQPKYNRYLDEKEAIECSTKRMIENNVSRNYVNESLAALNTKIDELEFGIILREEKFKQEILQNQLKKKNGLILEMHSLKQRNQNQSSLLVNSFILFLLGILFSKVFIC